MRPGAMTHGTDTEQRYVALDFALEANGLTVTAFDSPTIAPAGYYMAVAQLLDMHQIEPASHGKLSELVNTANDAGTWEYGAYRVHSDAATYLQVVLATEGDCTPPMTPTRRSDSPPGSANSASTSTGPTSSSRTGERGLAHCAAAVGQQ